MLYAIETRSLIKEFGQTRAVDNVSLQVEKGEVFGFLGPNGAGKSTTMMILTTLLRPTSGSALVSGLDVATQAARVRRKIGYVQQEPAVDEFLTGRENLTFLAKINHMEGARIPGRIDEVLDLIELEDRQDDAVLTYSGGMRKRLDIAGGLLHTPEVLFLDEPTVGLDIQTRRKIWEYIGKIHRELGMTIFISTHYMEEADSLCDRVGIIDHGKIQAVGSPREMKSAMGGDALSITVGGGQADTLADGLAKAGRSEGVSVCGDELTIRSQDMAGTVPLVFGLAAKANLTIGSVSMKRPTLDDVFISYTGHNLRDAAGGYDRRREHSKMRRLRA